MVQMPRITSQRLLEQSGPFVEFDTQCGEFALQISDADREGESAVGQQVQRRAGLGHHERIAVRQHDDVRDQPQRRGAGGGIAHRDEGVDGVVATRLQPSLRRRRMVGEPEAVEARRLGRGRDRRDARSGDQLRVVRDGCASGG